MKNSILVLLFSFMAVAVTAQNEDFRKQAPKPGPAPSIELSDYEQFQLDNGLTVIVVENRKLPQVSFQLLVDLPPIFEGEEAGAANMAGDLFSTGTTKRSKAEIDEAVDFIGASFNTSAGGMFGSCLTKNQEALLEIMSDVLLHPSFPEAEFDKLKTQTLSSLALSKDQPEAIAGQVAQVLIYGKEHPYGELTTEATVENIDIAACEKFYAEHFKPNISYLAIVGDITTKKAKTLAEKYFGSWEKGDVPVKTYEMPQKPAKTQVDFVDKPGAVQSIIDITYPVDFRPGGSDAIPASLMNQILGGNYGRLFKNIREDKGYTYGASSSLSPDKLVGSFSAGASVRNEVTDSAIVEFLNELKRIRDEKVTEEELRFAKNFRTGIFAIQLEQPSTVARYALNTARYKLPKDYYATYLERMNEVTAEEIQAAAQKYIHPERAHILVVGSKAEVADKLTPFNQTEAMVFRDIYGNPIEASAAVIPADLTGESIVESYLNAIGSKEKIAAVEDVTMVMAASVQGMQLEMTRMQKTPDKFAMTVAVGGMTMSEQVYDGENGKSIVQGQAQELGAEALEEMKIQAIPFPEARYAEMGYTLELNGIVSVNDQDAYQVTVTRPDGNKTTEFYNTESFLKVRVMATQDGPSGSVTVTSDYSDYQKVEGILWPHKMNITGLAPFPLNMEVNTIEVNKGIDDATFNVED